MLVAYNPCTNTIAHPKNNRSKTALCLEMDLSIKLDGLLIDASIST